MPFHYSIFLLTAVLSTQLHFAIPASRQRQMDKPIAKRAVAASNLWGGDHVQMEVTTQGAVLEFDCAIGNITEPLPSSQTRFRLKGTFTPRHGGPAQKNEANPQEQVVYVGRIEKDTMYLELLLGSKKRLGPFLLTRGYSGLLMRCL